MDTVPAASIIRRLLLAALLTATGPSRGNDEAPTPQQPDCNGVDLPAQPLDTALLRLAQARRLSIIFERDLARGRSIDPVSGDFACGELIDRLLDGSGLAGHRVAERVFVVRRAAPRHSVQEVILPADVARIRRPEDRPMEHISVIGRAVTGSRIQRPGLDLDAHVDLIDRQELDLSGLRTLAEILRFLPAVSGNSTSTLVSNGGDGSASITLRGLPASNTLVLLDGRRLNTDALRGESVDLNSIPLAAVERVEVLKDGASAIYGSDAIAGVVNVITRNATDGIDLSAHAGVSSRDDYRTRHYSALWGHDGENLALMLGGEWFDQGAVMSRDRELSRSSDDRPRGGIDKRSSATAPARIQLGEQSLILRGGADGDDPGDFRPATEDDRFEYRRFTTAIVPSRRRSLFARGRAAIVDHLDARFTALWTETEATTRLAPAPLFTGFEVLPLPVAADAGFNPFGVALDDVRRRIVELPSRIVDNDNRSRRLAAELRWRRNGSGMDLHLAHHETDAEEQVRNVLSGPALQQALGPLDQCRSAPGCVPLNLFGPPGSIDPAMLEWIGIDIASEATSSLDSLSLDGFGSLFALPAGSLEFALGAELRREELEIRPDPRARQQQIVAGNNFGDTSGERDIAEVYGELLIPLLAGHPGAELLELQIADRYSDYSDFGSTNNPRLSLRWRPLPQLLVRSSWARGFRAPTLRELHLTEQQSADFLTDPCARADRVAELPGCSLQSDPTLTQFLTLTGGNPELDPETARSFTVGLLWTPEWVPGRLRASVDYYDIEQENVVDSSAQFVVNENAESGRFPDRVRRDASGNITSVTATNINIGRRQVSGADFRVDWQLPASRFGVFELAVNAAHIRRFRDQLDPTMPAQDQAGTFNDAASEGNGALPHWKANFGIHWTLGGWGARYGLHHVAALDEQVPGTDRQREIDDWTIHNVQFSHGWLTATAEARVTLGLNNVLDQAAPFSAAAFNDSHDSRTHDLIGRFLYARISTSL